MPLLLYVMDRLDKTASSAAAQLLILLPRMAWWFAARLILPDVHSHTSPSMLFMTACRSGQQLEAVQLVQVASNADTADKLLASVL